MNKIYGKFEFPNFTDVLFVMKDENNKVLGKTIYPFAKRKRILTIGETNYVITYLMTWNKEITLQKEGLDEIIAKFSQTGWLGKHQIEVKNVGTLISSRVSLDFKARYLYTLNGRDIGMVENTLEGSSQKGRTCNLSEDLPLEIQLFMLSR